jgi:DNA-binding NarL/FixJ family response regulator
MRVLIVTDGPFSAEALRRALRHAPACRVIGYVDARFQCAPAVAQAQPDVILVEELASTETTLARIAEARVAVPEAKLVLLTSRMESAWLSAASAAGVDAAISRTAQPAAVGVLVREVAAGNVFHAFAAAPKPARATKLPGVDLTARELEILRRVAAGASNSQMATQLFVTEQTIKFHLSNIYRKLGVANRNEARRTAQLAGMGMDMGELMAPPPAVRSLRR